MARATVDRLANDAHLWLSRLSGETDPETPGVLSADEREHADSVRHPRARAHFMAGRLLARRALSAYADVPARAWRFETTSDGRPEVAAPPSAADLRFNLSHTDGLAACLVTRRLDCGVDVERVDRDIDVCGIAAHSFAPREVAALERLAAARQRQRFFELWTLKEAFLKALGSGIRLRLDAISFELDAAGQLRSAETTLTEPGCWSFTLLRPTPHHIAATAVRGNAVLACRILDSGDEGRAVEMPATRLDVELRAR